MHYYTHNPASYLMATAHLDDRRDLFFRRLRDAYVFREGRLPVLVADVARLVRAKTEAARKAVAAVLSEFFTWSDDAGWRLPELDAQIEVASRGRGGVAGAHGVVAAAAAQAFKAPAPVTVHQAPMSAPMLAGEGGPTADAVRQQKSRLVRRYLFAELGQRGQIMPGKTSGAALQAAVNALPDRADAWRDVWAAVRRDMAAYEAKRSRDVAANSPDEGGLFADVTADHVTNVTDVTANNQEPITQNGVARDVTLVADCDVAAHTGDVQQLGSGVADVVPVRDVAGHEKSQVEAGKVVQALSVRQAPLAGMLAAVPVVAAAGKYTAVVEAMRAAGLVTVSAGDAELRRLVDAGAPVDAFGEAATEAVRRGKPLAWALARVKGKREDAAVGGAEVVGGGHSAATGAVRGNEYLEQLRRQEALEAAMTPEEREAAEQRKRRAREDALAKLGIVKRAA